MSVIVWFRNDLRLFDNPALHYAAQYSKKQLHLVYISPENKEESLGSASKWWLHQSLLALQEDIQSRGGSLILRRGSHQDVLEGLVYETKANALFWNRRYDPEGLSCDKKIKEYFKNKGLSVYSFNACLLFEPWDIKNKSGKPFQVFTPFWKECQRLLQEHIPAPTPPVLRAHAQNLYSLSVFDLCGHPSSSPDWSAGLRKAWIPGEKGAHRLFDHFIDNHLKDYGRKRDYPSLACTSRLSPHLRFGEISVKWIVHRCHQLAVTESTLNESIHSFLRELGWREFAHHLLYHFPNITTHPLRKEFSKMPWEDDETAMKAWQKGQTGYPLIDAGMRQLWQTGWMHNRVRMLVASFLIKDLLIDWRKGAAWFWDTLVDADLANNTASWQWVAGCGADAAPYFRIFNPTLQSLKFDPEGHYIRQYVPELAKLPKEFIHTPWEAPSDVLSKANIKLDTTYSSPIVDHDDCRKKALEIFRTIRTPL